jgi:GNAT superfamily N-acetyltransferase
MITEAIRDVHVSYSRGGGSFPFGDITVDFEPADSYEFANEASSGQVPGKYLGYIENKFRDELGSYSPVKVVLKNGRFHEADSSEMGYKLVIEMAVRELRRRTSVVRPATTADIPELVRLREVFFQEMYDKTPEVNWKRSFESLLRQRLGTDLFATFVIDGDSGLVACGTGLIHQALPGPWNLAGTKGEIVNMVTEPAHQRRGHARAIMVALLDWFHANHIVKVVLSASPAGETIYRDLGFTDPDHPVLEWRP